MNTKLLASIAVFVLLAAVVSISMTNSAFADEKADKKAAEMKAKADKKAAKDSGTGQATGSTAASEVSVDMAVGTASNQDCADQCYVPNTVTVTVGGKVTWKNVDSAAHTATAVDGSFDTSLVTAGGTSSNTFNTAGSYPYMCIVHPWMKGTVNVQ
ncbi:MAG: cupredoxin domain-containing protein [Candidatus Nitrosotenuis sp.]